MVKTKAQRIRGRIIACVVVLALLAVCVLLSLGYPGKWIDAAKENKTLKAVVAQFGDQKITKGDCVELYENQVNYANYYNQYLNYMSQMYGLEGSYTLKKSDYLDLRDNTVKSVAETRVLYVKAEELGFGEITKDEDAELKKQAADTFKSYLDMYIASYGQDEKTAREYLAYEGMTESMLYMQAKDSTITNRLSDYVNADTAITEDEVTAKYDALVTEHQSSYETGYYAFETAMRSENTVCWMPEGYRTVKHILLAPEDETLLDTLNTVKDEISALDTAAEDYQTKLDEANQKLADAEKAILAAVQEKADAVYAAIAAGEDFDALIEKYTADTGSLSEPIKTTGYYVSEHTTSMDTAFLIPALALENVGDVAEPSVGMYGVYIVKYVSDVVPGAVPLDEKNHDAIQALALTEKKEALYSEKRAAWIEEAGITYTCDAWVIE